MSDRQRGREASRRDVLRRLASAGVAIGGIGTLSGVASAGGDPDTGDAGGGSTNHIGIDHELSASDVPVGSVCDIVGVGCLVVTVAAAMDGIPGDELLLAKACGGATGACTAGDSFLGEHGDVNVNVFTITESAGGYEAGDAVVVPSGWDW